MECDKGRAKGRERQSSKDLSSKKICSWKVGVWWSRKTGTAEKTRAILWEWVSVWADNHTGAAVGINGQAALLLSVNLSQQPQELGLLLLSCSEAEHVPVFRSRAVTLPRTPLLYVTYHYHKSGKSGLWPKRIKALTLFFGQEKRL